MLIEESIKDTIIRLDNINWFGNCGKENIISKYEISYAKNIDSAIKHCSSDKWGNITLEKSQDIHSYLIVYRVDTPYSWNEVVLEIKKETLSSILQKAEKKWNEKYDESEEITKNLRWNILNILTLNAFREYKNEPFHEELLNIYEQGYFPCGWKGTYPEGKIVIF